jgi:glycosyltransferase involved in cell wall biosynthesis
MTKTPKILMIVENLPAPLDRRVWPEAITLRDSGYQVSVISPRGSTDCRESYDCVENIHIYRYSIPTARYRYLAYAMEYGVALLMTFWLSLKVLFRHGFDVIHVANPPDIFFVIGLFYRPFGKKFVFDQHDLSPELFKVIFNKRSKFIYDVMRFFEKSSYQVADLVITTNESQKKFAIERGRCRAERVYVVRNSSHVAQSRVALPAGKLNSGSGSPYLLGYVGIMGIQDGVAYTLYTLNELVNKRGRRDVSLVLIGDGADLSSLQNLAHELNLDQSVNFTGWLSQEKMIHHLSTIDIGLVPDPQNGLNEFSTMLKTMDYMAMGKPMVGFDLAETRSTALDAALYATPNLAEDFANKIEALLDDEELRIKMGQFGRRRFEEELTWAHTSKNLLSAYQVLFPRGEEKPLALLHS